MLIFKIVMCLLLLGLTIQSAIIGDKQDMIINFVCALVWVSFVYDHIKRKAKLDSIKAEVKEWSKRSR